MLSFPRVVAALQPWAEISERLRRISNWAGISERLRRIQTGLELANAFGVFKRGWRLRRISNWLWKSAGIEHFLIYR